MKLSPLLRLAVLAALLAQPIAAATAALAQPRATVAETVAQSGHTGQVSSVAFSPGGELLASGSYDQTVRLWDLRSAKLLRSLPLGDAAEAVAFTPDGRTLLAAGTGGAVVAWDVETGRELRRFGVRSERMDVAFSPDGRLVAEVGGFGDIIVTDAATGRAAATLSDDSSQVEGFATPAGFYKVAFSPDGKSLAAATSSDGVKVWNVAALGAKPRTIKTGELEGGIGFSPDGRAIVTGGGEKNPTVMLWDAATGRRLRVLLKTPKPARAFAFSPDGKTLACVAALPDGENGLEQGTEIKLVETSGGKPLRSLANTSCDWQGCELVAFSPDGRVVAGGGGDILKGTVQLWDAASGKELDPLAGRTERVSSLAFAPGKEPGGRLVAGVGYGAATRLWEMATAREVASHRLGYPSLTPDGRTLAGRDGLAGVAILDAATGRRKQTIKVASASGAQTFALSPDGGTLATAGDPVPLLESSMQPLRLWSAETGAELRTLAPKSGGAAFSPDGRWLAGFGLEKPFSINSPNEGFVRLWDAAGWKEVRQARLQAPTALAFSHDGRLLAAGSREPLKDRTGLAIIRGVIVLEETATGAGRRELKGFDGPVNAVAFSPDDKWIAGGDAAGRVLVFDAATGALLRTLQGHSGGVEAVAFSPDGRLLATGGRDGQIVFWDAATGEEVVRWIVLGENDHAVVAPGGYYAATRRGALEGVAFRVGRRALPFEQFDLKYNRPDVVFARLGYAGRERVAGLASLYARRLKLLGFTEEMLGSEFRLPEVKLLGATPPAVSREKTVELQIAAADAEHLLDRLIVTVNDVPLGGAAGIGLRDRRVKEHRETVRLELSAGVNRVQVSAVNGRGAESLRATFVVSYDGPAPRPELYVLAVGVSKYKDGKYDLAYAAKDADDLTALLGRRAGEPERALQPGTNALVERPKSFYQTHVLKLTDAEATREKVLAAREFLSRARVDDQVVVFFAGHGLRDERQNYFFATHDIDAARPADRGLSFEELESLLDGLASRRKLLLVDTCFAGEIYPAEPAPAAPPPGAQAAPAPARAADGDGGRVTVRDFPRPLGGLRPPAAPSTDLLRELFADLRRGSGAAVIAAAGGAEYALESGRWKNGVFTYSLLRGLESLAADADHDGEVRFSELRDFVSESVRRLTEGRQRPAARRESLSNDFRVY